MEIPSHFSITGFDPDLNKAFESDLHDMIDFITNRWNLSREDAYTICSTVIDFNISQVGDVNNNMHGPASTFHIHRGLGTEGENSGSVRVSSF